MVLRKNVLLFMWIHLYPWLSKTSGPKSAVLSFYVVGQRFKIGTYEKDSYKDIKIGKEVKSIIVVDKLLATLFN